jgi:competence protein ComEC
VWTREPIAVTAAAQIGVAPLMIPVFGSIPLASLPANGLAAPLMAPITIGGLGAGVVGGVVRPFVPGAAAVLVWPVGALVRALEGIAAAWASIPVGIGAREAIALAGVGLAVAWFRVRRARGRPARSRPTRGPSVGSPAHVPGGDHEHGRALSHR